MTSNEDIADPYIIIRDTSNPVATVYETTLPYFQRSLEIDTTGKIGQDIEHAGGTVQICLLAKNSKTDVRAWHGKQCRDVPKHAALVSDAPEIRASTTICIAVIILKKYLLLE